MNLAPRAWTAVVALTFAVSFTFSYGPDALRMSLPGAIAISAASATSVWLSARSPAWGLLAVTVLAVSLPAFDSTFEALDLVVVLVAFRATMVTDLPWWAPAGVSLGTLTLDDAWLRVSQDQSFARPSVLYPLLLTVLAVGLGLQSRQLRRQHAALVLLQDADRERAVSDERRRIARDLHDVAAHHLSALVVRNKLAQRIDTTEALEDAAAFTARTAAEALDSLRQVVHVLNTEDDAPRRPSPTLADLDEVVGRMEEAGLVVARAGGDVPRATREVELAVVRIVQEALANVLRHRGPGRAWLDLRGKGDGIAVTVEDDGPATWQEEMADRTWHRPGSYGLLGMRERAEACGGELVVGRSPHGGWRVSAVLPATPS